VEKFQLSFSRLLGKLKNKSEGELPSAQESRIKDSKMSYRTGTTQREQLNTLSSPWSKDKRSHILNQEGSWRERDEKEFLFV
jgi:hypothetical protein